MSWLGSNIRELSKDRNISLTKLGEEIGVSRQTINEWIKGQIPKGHHLLNLCRIFGVNPNSFFEHQEEDSSIVVPVHRMRGTAKVTEESKKKSKELASEYKIFFKNYSNSLILPVIKTHLKNEIVAKSIANTLRGKVDLQSYDPIDYEKTFALMKELGIFLILREFPKEVKSYAFFTKIYDNRVVFVNSQTNVIDLIFPLLHEIVHAIQDENNRINENEESFCDSVASYIQFSDAYVGLVHEAVKDLPDALKVNKLKKFATNHSHALFGLVKRIKQIDPGFNLLPNVVGGADTNLKKRFPTLRDILFANDDARNFANIIHSLSPLFFKALIQQIENISNRKLAILLGVENLIDVQEVKKEILKSNG